MAFDDDDDGFWSHVIQISIRQVHFQDKRPPRHSDESLNCGLPSGSATVLLASRRLEPGSGVRWLPLCWGTESWGLILSWGKRRAVTLSIFAFYTAIETQGRAGIGVYSTALSTGLTSILLEDFFLTSQFPDCPTQPVGGFINNILRGLLRINY
jgi:hypothetical protein